MKLIKLFKKINKNPTKEKKFVTKWIDSLPDGKKRKKFFKNLNPEEKLILQVIRPTLQEMRKECQAELKDLKAPLSVDRILDKISTSGLDSLTKKELSFLNQSSQKL